MLVSSGALLAGAGVGMVALVVVRRKMLVRAYKGRARRSDTVLLRSAGARWSTPAAVANAADDIYFRELFHLCKCKACFNTPNHTNSRWLQIIWREVVVKLEDFEQLQRLFQGTSNIGHVHNIRDTFGRSEI